MARVFHAALSCALAGLAAGGALGQTASTTTYGYDALGRLETVTRPNSTATYEYDSADNRSRYVLVSSSGNHPPTASNKDASATAGGAQINVPILTSLTDVDNDPLTLSLIAPFVTQGSASVAPDGKSINYTASSSVPAGDYFINYRVSDTHATADAYVKVTVSAASNPGGGGSEIIPVAFTASSSYSSYGYTGLTATNGMRDGQFLANNTIHGTNSETDAWIKADLGSNKTVTSVKLAPANAAAAGSWGAGYLNGALVQYSTDNASWTTVTTVSGASEGAYTTVNMGGVTARYVRVQRSNFYVGLGDFMVYGSGGSNPPTGNPPTASTSSATVAYNSASNVIPLNITGNYTSVAYVSGTSHGSVQAVGAQIYYTPFTNYSGSDSFTYTASNAYGTSNVATGNITVSPPAGSPPTASTSSATVAYNSSSNVIPLNITGNYTSVTAVSGTTHGYVQAVGAQMYYTPFTNYSGSDSFTYTATNAYGTSNVATGNITVSPPAGSPPTASTSYATVAYNSSSNVIPLNITGNYTSVTAVGGTTHGYIQAVSSQMYYTPHTNYSGSDSFTYTAANAYGTSNVATGNITVSPPPNQAPTARENTTVMFQSQSVSIDPRLATENQPGDSDPDGDPLTITWVGQPSVSYGRLNGVDYSGSAWPGGVGSFSVSGQTINYTAPNLCSTYGCHLVLVFYYTISDGRGGTSTAPHVIVIYSQP